MTDKRLVSVWDMLKKFEAGHVAESIRAVTDFARRCGVTKEFLSPEQKDIISNAEYANLLNQVHNLGLTASLLGSAGLQKLVFRQFNTIQQQQNANEQYSRSELDLLFSCLDKLAEATTAALFDKQFYSLSSDYAAYLDPNYPMFGSAVNGAFPSAIYDIEEAHRCVAFERWTASVMHTMRVLEVGLGALAKHVDVLPKENWNATLNDIEAALRAVQKKKDGVESEKWAAEAGTHLRFMKNAYRNHAMHPLEKYDEERAMYILREAKSFLQHLATKIHES